ncbi:hypothetical protein C8F01DRAFT_1156083 [Mycena amicta]|nr:hypothetical protein C8F01DRAFT_1156083 [Mycena amicta]
MHPLKLLPTTLLLSASVAVATHSESSHRQHSELAQRLSSGESESELEKRATYSNVPCPSCTAWGALDMTKGLFQYFDTLANGEFTASWSYASDNDDSDDGDDSPPPPPKKTTTTTTHHSSTHTTTHTTTTSTTHSTTTTHSSSSSHSSSHSASATHSSASASPTPSPSAPASPDSEVIKNFSDSMLGLAALVLQAPGAQ